MIDMTKFECMAEVVKNEKGKVISVDITPTEYQVVEKISLTDVIDLEEFEELDYYKRQGFVVKFLKEKYREDFTFTDSMYEAEASGVEPFLLAEYVANRVENKHFIYILRDYSKEEIEIWEKQLMEKMNSQ